MWVKLKENISDSPFVTVGKYYKVVAEHLDPMYNEYVYEIVADDSQSRIYIKDNFEKPITHAVCIDNIGYSDVLTFEQTYEIVRIHYPNNRMLITIKNDVDNIDSYSGDRFQFTAKTQIEEEKSDKMFVKLKPNDKGYVNVTWGRYYEVLEENYDPVDKEYMYLIKNDRFEQGYYSQSDFEEPVTHARCIANELHNESLTYLQDYEIISFQYVGAGLVVIENDNGYKGTYSLARFNFINKNKPVEHNGYTHVVCKYNDMITHELTYGSTYEIIQIHDGSVEIINDKGNHGWYALGRFDFVTEDGVEPIEIETNPHFETVTIHDEEFDCDITTLMSKREAEELRKGDSVDYGKYTHVICKDNDGQWRSLTHGKKYEIVEMNNSMVKIVDDVDEYGWYAVVRFEFITEEPEIYNLGSPTELLEPLPTTKYHITYSLQYAAGAELVDISKKNIIGIDGEIVSKGRTWVIETEKGTVIIPFKAIIHMHPQY